MAITFQEIMDFYPKHNESVYKELKENLATSSSSLVPFVGAGLSVDFGYPLWKNALKELLDSVYDKENRNDDIKAKIEKYELLEAAEDIIIVSSLSDIVSEMNHIFDYRKFAECEKEKIESSADYLLPILFKKSPVMTTNFDTIIERIYAGQQLPFDKVVSPYQPEDLIQIRQQGAHGLFKLHGTIGQTINSYEGLVFTKSQYEDAYNPKSKLANELIEWFKNKQLLFLGCSLTIDETIKLLQKVFDKNPAVRHYAIIACKKEEMTTRIREIGNIGIRAIFYQDRQHDSVRVVLERLLEELNPEAYRQLPFRITDVKKKDDKKENPFLYNSEYIPFTGRASELEQLEKFCFDSERISWWAVTGSGGIGKSRLVYEFKKKMEEKGWRVVWLTAYDYDELSELKLDVNKTLVVADDVQANLEKLGQWLARISKSVRSEPLRVLMLERDGKDLDNATWSETLQNGEVSNSIQKEMCYSESFLELKALSEADLKDIISNYSEKRGKHLNSDYLDALIKTLEKVDPKLKRPLYALAIAEAVSNGKDPIRWDKNELLDYIVVKEMDFYKQRFRNLWGGKRKKVTETELEQLLTQSCIYGMIPVDEIVEQAPENWKRLDKIAKELDLELDDMLHQIGVVRKVLLRKKNSDETVEINAIVLDCPDLVKEYLAIKNTIDKNKLDLLLKNDWEKDPALLYFLIRILYDYPDKFSDKPKVLERFLDGEPSDDICSILYDNLLVGITKIKNEEIAKQVVERLKQKAEKTNGEFGYEIYATAIANLVFFQSEKYFFDIEQQLYELQERFNSNEYIAKHYMRLLSCYPENSEADKAKILIDRMESVRSRFENNEEIAIYYTGTFYNIFRNMGIIDEIEQKIKVLDILTEKFQENEIIVEDYFYILCLKLDEQSLDLQRVWFDKIVELKSGFQCDEEHIDLYYNTLLKMCYAYYTNYILSVTNYVSVFEEVLNSNENILGCVCSFFKNNCSECSKHLNDDLDMLSNRYNAIEAIEKYADLLVSLSLAKKQEVDVIKIQNLLNLLLQHYSDNECIKLSYAMVYFNLSLKQSQKASMLTIQNLRSYLLQNDSANELFQKELDKYLKRHPNDREKYKSLIMSIEA